MKNVWDGFVGRVQWVLDEIKKGNIDETLSSGTTSVKQSSQQSATPQTVKHYKLIQSAYQMCCFKHS